MTASVWQRLTVGEAARERLARRQSGAALALARLGQIEPTWLLLKHSPYPEARTRLIHRMGPAGFEAATLVARLDAEPDVFTQRARLLSLGEYTAEQTPVDLRERLTPKLLEWYRDDADPGVQGVIGWLLRHGNVWTWRQESGGPYPGGTQARPSGDKEYNIDIIDHLRRMLRGASFRLHPSNVLAACRFNNQPANPFVSNGLRVARTCG